MKFLNTVSKQKIVASLLGIVTAALIYFPHYALTDNHTKLNCSVFLILGIVLLWVPTESLAALFAVDLFFEIGLVLLLVFISTITSLHTWPIYLLIILILAVWIGMVLLKNQSLTSKNRQVVAIRLISMLIFAILAYLSGFYALLMASPVGLMVSGITIYIGIGLFIYYLILAASIWQNWFKGSISWVMIIIAIVFHMFFAYNLSPETMLIPGICEVIIVLLLLRMNMLLEK
ncbi:hypothetical protein FP435_07120 [Lactobacillus sp. PV037]|uniref:hypothetical protein n=1 Tax=Lactobacillus sp. PV037 TaxID=2594496 RepID=UPI0022400DE3|nr:hypothetical protein [Lactobacillus sp. PV037]QNQ84203.1 hypothetical protein FP435_07120 [Lactobacillus sp. PV037]